MRQQSTDRAEDLTLHRKHVLWLRWLLIIATSYLLYFTDPNPSRTNPVLIFVYIFSNVALHFLPLRFFFHRWFYYLLVPLDTGFIALAIFLTGTAATDFYLIFFLVIIIAAIGHDLRYIVIGVAAITFFYGWMMLSMGFPVPPLRIPFLIVVATFIGYLVEQAKAEIARSKQLLADKQELERVQQALRESEEKFRSIVESTNEWIWAIDQEGRMIYNNPAVEHMLGFRPDELVGADRLALVHDEDRRIVLDMLPELSASRRGWAGVILRYRHKDGRFRYLESNAVPVLDGNSLVIGYRGADRDITERRHLEEQFRHSQKMEAVGQLAGGIAHDFNNLLTAIIGCSDLLMERVASDENLRRDVEEIRRAAKRAAGLTQQLLAFSRRQVLQPQEIDLNTVVSDMKAMLKRLMAGNIEVVTQLDTALRRVRADRGQLEQVIMNLAINARDAMPNGGRLTLQTQNLMLDDSSARTPYFIQPGPYVTLTVCDTGVGMGTETRRHIFEPFFTTKEVGKGTGLGLATVYGIVKQSGGYILCASEPGKGTTFDIYLPPLE